MLIENEITKSELHKPALYGVCIRPSMYAKSPTQESWIDVGGKINVVPGKFDNNNSKPYCNVALY